MADQELDIIIRCHEAPLVARMVGRLQRQRHCVPRIAVFDCSASDASRHVADAHGVRFFDVSAMRASPGAIMNHAMGVTRSSVVVFLNADAIPLSETCVGGLVAHLQSTPMLAAALGRQVPRQSSLTSLTREILRVGEVRANGSGGTFSMSAAAVSRGAWHHHPFDERLRYAEDLEWMARAKRGGWTTTHVASAPFEQSRRSELRQHIVRPTRPTPVPRGTRSDMFAARRSAMLEAVVGRAHGHPSGASAPA